MENFKNRAWTRNLFRSSYSRLLRIVNAVVALIASRSERLAEIYFSSKYGKSNVAIFNSYYFYSILYSKFNYLFNIQLLFSIQCFSSTQLVIQYSIIYWTYTKHGPGSMDHPMDPVHGPRLIFKSSYLYS